MNKFNFAIIGCGRIAERHANHIINLGKLAAVCDIIPEYADSFGEKYKANSYYCSAPSGIGQLGCLN